MVIVMLMIVCGIKLPLGSNIYISKLLLKLLLLYIFFHSLSYYYTTSQYCTSRNFHFLNLIGSEYVLYINI